MLMILLFYKQIKVQIPSTLMLINNNYNRKNVKDWFDNNLSTNNKS